MNFLPKDYQAPKSSSGLYMKLQEGDNKIRILSRPVMGWEDWQEKTPVRFKFEDKPKTSIDSKKPIKHFWAFIVWNYLSEQIQILHITQASIRNSIEVLCKDEDWGEPWFYDLKIIKSGEGKDTEYAVNPLPHKDLQASIKEAFQKRPCNLDALFDSKDPFSSEWKEFTPGIFSKDDVKAVPSDEEKTISPSQAKELGEILKMCDEKYNENVWKTLKHLSPNVKSLNDIPVKLYERMLNGAIKNSEKERIAA